MRWTHFFVFVLATTIAKEEETNEVSPTPKINLDANLRRALLKALTELENEENEKKENKDKVVEKASASALSFFASTTTTQKPIIVIQKSHGLQHKPITSLEKEQFLTSATSSFSPSSNQIHNDVKTTKPLLPKVTPTTPTITTTTQENEAKVEDVQFFSAPLVAAFTVHQDERGLPKKVEPIYRQKTEKPEIKTTQEPFRDEQIRTQLALQEKQRALEAEILRLKQQQQQQNYLIRQQQILHQQQLQLQKQKILDEQNRLRQNFLPTVRNTIQATTPRNLVSFQPSISFTTQQHSSAVLPLNAQQLPVKNAANFHLPFASTSNYQQFNYLNHQQPPLENNLSNFNVLPTVQPQLTAPKVHRVFRQEANTGNFGFNNAFSSFNHHQGNRFFRSNVETIKSTPFHFNQQIQPPIVNQHLNHLLYNSGLIRGKQQEDLNIVSKVLALNHYGGDYRFDASNINEQRVEPPVIKKV